MALSDNKDRTLYAGELREFPVKASAHIYKGGLVMAIRGTGYAIPGADTANGEFLGIAEEEAYETSGVDGAINVLVRIGQPLIEITLSSVAITDVGKPVYISNDDAVALTSTNLVAVGQVMGVVASNLALVLCNKGVPVVQQAHVADTGALTAAQTTDSSGGTAGSSPYTFAAMTNLDTLTDLTSGTADDTVAATTVLIGTLGGAADGSWEIVGATNGGDVSGAIMNNFQEVHAELTDVNNNFKELTDQIVTQKAFNTVVMNDASKISAALNALQVDVAAIRTKQIAIITALESARILKTS